MNFLSKADFVAAMRDYNKYKRIIAEYRDKLKELNYLRFEKVKSPLDYDIVGYDGGEPIRQIKTPSFSNPEVIRENQDRLDEKIESVEGQIELYVQEINKVDSELRSFPKSVRPLLRDRYIEKKTLRELLVKYGLRVNESGLHKYINSILDERYEI